MQLQLLARFVPVPEAEAASVALPEQAASGTAIITARRRMANSYCVLLI
jgi:hypothetical protein